MSKDEQATSAGLVVLGMHRSGTSALAGALGFCGAWVGEDAELTKANHENPKGFWERRDVRSICDTLLHSAEADWWKIAAFEHSAIPHSALSPQGRAFKRIVSELDTHGTWVIKEPRLCLLISYLRTLISRPVSILIYRNPVEVAQSLRVRNGFGLADGLALWEIYNRNALLASREMPTAVVAYADLIAEPAETLAGLLLKLESFGVGGLELPSDEVIDGFISQDLKHQNFADSETAGFLLPAQQSLWDQLRSDDPLNFDATDATPNPVRQQLRDFETRRTTLHDVSAKLKRRNASVKKFGEAVDKLERENNTLRSDADKRKRRAAELEAQVAELGKRAEELAAGFEKQKRQLEAHIDDLDNRLKASARRLKNAEDVAATRATELRRQVARASAAETSANALQAKVEEIYASNSWKISAPLRFFSRLAKRIRGWIRNVFRLLGWLLTGQFGRAGQALLPRFRRYVPHGVRRLIPGKVRRLFTSRLASPREGDSATAPGQMAGRLADNPRQPFDSGTLQISHGVLQTQFGRELQRITEQKGSRGIFAELMKSDERLAHMAERLRSRPERPLVSIIMPTWNRAGIVGNAIATVLEQEYANWELLVCDDDSSDRTEDVIREYHDSRIRYLKLPRGGAAAARNAGLAQANGSIIAYLDSDNFWHPEYLNAVVLGFLENPGRSAVYADYVDFDVQKSGKVKRAKARRPIFNHEKLLDKPFIDLNSFAHKRELYDCFGGFNEDLKRRQDYDLILKYTWLRDPLHIDSLTTLYQRNEGLAQITREQSEDQSCVSIIDSTIEGYFRDGLPVVSESPAKKVTIISWDLCRNHFSKPFAVAEALSKEYDVQLISFRFFDEPIFPPLEGVNPDFETLYLPGGPFPDFFAAMKEALNAITGDIIYVVKPRLPSLGLALLANYQRSIPVILEINDLETVVSAPKKGANHVEASFGSTDLDDTELLNPYSDLWSELMHPLAVQVPVVATHNRAIDGVFGNRCLYMRNFKDEAVYDPAAYDRDTVRSELGFEPGDRVILFGGLIRKHKGIYEQVELVDRLKDPRYKLLFAGSRTTPDQQKLIERYGDRVRVLPPQDRESMARINYAADLVILWLDPDVAASHYQMPYKASDAFAMGPAVIANDISDLGTLGAQGYLRIVPFGDWDTMTRAVTDLFDEPDETKAVSKAARRLFLRQFSYAAARGGFRLAAERALANRPSVLPVAEEFAGHFNHFYRKVTGSQDAFVEERKPRRERRPDAFADVAGFGEAPEDASILLADAADLSTIAVENPSGVVAIMPSLDPKKAVETARLLVRRAGMDVIVVVVLDSARQGFVRTLNDTARKIEVAYIVYVAEDALPGIDWLKHGYEALEETGKGLLAFNDGKWRGRIAGFGMVRKSWVRQVYDRAILYPGYRSHKADNELTVIARIMDEFVYEPTATVVELDRSKAFTGGEAANTSEPSSDRQLFYDRMVTSFDSRFHWQDVARFKDQYLNLRKLRSLQTTAYTPDEASIVVADAADLDALGPASYNEIVVVMPCLDAAAAQETADLLAQRAGIKATYYLVEDTLRQGFIVTLNATAARLNYKYIVYAAEDAFPGEDWLKIAYDALEETGHGLLAFNCGKWHGRVAAFGMVRKDFVEGIYGKGAILNPEYNAHKADNELTVIARVRNELTYMPDSVLIENDPDKQFTETMPEDKATFHRRFLSGFDGRIEPEELKPLARAYFVPLPPGTEYTSGNGPDEQHSSAEHRYNGSSRSEPDPEVAAEDTLTALREAVLRIEKASDTDDDLRTVFDALKSSAQQALERGTQVVTEKTTLPPSGDPRDYWHAAPYWWPDPNTPDGLPYIRKDGERVPGTELYESGSEKYDRSRLQRVFDDSFSLALASYFFDEEKYAEAGVRVLERFFLDPAEGMHPHLKFAQVRRGHNRDMGAASGLIETKDIYYFLDAVRLLKMSGSLTTQSESTFRQWLGNFLDWLLNSEQGKEERLAKNNHGTCYDLQVGSIATYLGEHQVVFDTIARAQSRITVQFAPSGEQPKEVSRKNALHYCCFNLQSWINLAEFASRSGMDFWRYRAPSGAGLKVAAGWLLSRTENQWPIDQAKSFDANRLWPIRFAAAEHDAFEDNERSPYSITPLFHPDCGIRPFWNLGIRCLGTTCNTAESNPSGPNRKNLVAVQAAGTAVTKR